MPSDCPHLRLLYFQTLYHLCHYTICHDESQFVNAEKFLPERWLRGSASQSGYYQHHPYSFIPFGVGVRACIGRRVAELEMYFALTRVRGSGVLSSPHSVCPNADLAKQVKRPKHPEGKL